MDSFENDFCIKNLQEPSKQTLIQTNDKAKLIDCLTTRRCISTDTHLTECSIEIYYQFRNILYLFF